MTQTDAASLARHVESPVAWLQCEGTCYDVEKHWFSHAERTKGWFDAPGRYMRIFYRCGDCGRIRQWGMEE